MTEKKGAFQWPGGGELGTGNGLVADKVLSYVAQSTVQGIKVRKLWQCCGEAVGFQGLPFPELRIFACLFIGDYGL